MNTKSNHPPSVLKEVPRSINQRLSHISSTKEDFDRAKGEYQKALDESGYTHILDYGPEPESEDTQNQNRTKKKRNIIWFNPPYSSAVTTNVGKKFLALVDKHFHKNHPLRPLLNRNTVKISYS